jgi:hypothetical protein
MTTAPSKAVHNLSFAMFSVKMFFVIRVTILGEFSPIGRLFTLFSFLKITEAHSCFFHGIIYTLILTIIGLGYILGDSFTNTSGHSGHDSLPHRHPLPIRQI